MNKIILSPPASNYLDFVGATRTLGTYTLEPRPGRFWRFFKTVRYNWRQQSWINQIGLRNPGIYSLGTDASISDKIISIHGFTDFEWITLLYYLNRLGWCDYIELNLSCPNVVDDNIIDTLGTLARVLPTIRKKIIAKLPPVNYEYMANSLYNNGVRMFHCCNTIPSPGGGISGKPLKQFSLSTIRHLRAKWNDIQIIGGGGITHKEDVLDYKCAGADYFSLGTVLLNPFNWPRVKRIIRETY